MSQTFANTINNNPIYADRAEKDAAGNTISTTYATKSEIPTVELFEAVYGTTTYADITAAIAAKKIVYCRVSPSGASRMAFLAYIGSNTVEFQYYRSLSSRSATNQLDEVYVYTVAASGWTTTTRKAGVLIAAGTGLTSSYASGTVTINGKETDQTYDATSTNPQSGVAVAGALAGKEDAFTVGDGLEMVTSGNTRTLQVEAPVDIVAGPGIVIDNPDGNTMRVSQAYPTDETVLWTGNLYQTGTSEVLSETVKNFDRLNVYVRKRNGTTGTVGRGIQITTMALTFESTNGSLNYINAVDIASNAYTQNTIYLQFAYAGTSFNLLAGTKFSNATFSNNITSYDFVVEKIVGVHRIANN